jgi:hypothetical protein
MKYLLAFDPGDTTGWAAFDEEGSLMNMGHILFSDLPEFLAKYGDTEISYVVVEDFVLFAKRAVKQAGSRMKASQVIGMLKLWAAQKNAILVMQQANIKPAAMKWSQMHMPSDHSQTHQFDAYLHGYYWLHTHGIIKTQLQLEIEAQNG